MKKIVSFLACALGFSACTSPHLYLLVGAYSDGTTSGISVYDFNTQTGDLEYLSDVKGVVNPSYLVVSPDEKEVYSVNETANGAVSAFRFDKQSATLRFLNSQPTNGGDPCFIHINKSKTFIATANYSGGSISVLPVRKDGTLDKLAYNIPFSPESHIHTVAFTPDNKYLLATDLGTDQIYTLTLPEVSSVVKLPAGSGPRHLAFHPNGKYLYGINELAGTVTAFKQDGGKLSILQHIAADTTSVAEKKGSADIHLSSDGRFLYASNRLATNGIAIFSVNSEDGKLTRIGYQETGIHPRNFILSPDGKFLLCANRDSNNIQIFAINQATGLLQNTGKVIQSEKPVCLQWLGK